MNSEQMLHVNGVELCVQAFGEASDPAVLLIGGAEASMDWWDDELCDLLAAGGRFVIRYDTRDTGRSTTFPVGAPTYGGDALIADAVGLLDALGIAAAHVVGVSMGGGIAQHIAVHHPDRVTALTLIAATPGGPDAPDLPPMSERLVTMFAEQSEDAGPDWSDREAVIAHYLDGERAFAGSVPLDEPRLRRVIGRAYDRSPAMPAAQNHWLLEGGESVRDRLGEIRVPTLVLHGTEDPLFPYGHGEALAREIPGATLLPMPGVGHQMPPPQTWNAAVPAILAL